MIVQQLLHDSMYQSAALPHQQVQSVPPLPFPLLANLALSLENLTATTRMKKGTTAAIVVLLTSHVSLTTQPLALDSGSCYHFLAQQTVVAARVSGVENVFRHISVSSTYPG